MTPYEVIKANGEFYIARVPKNDSFMCNLTERCYFDEQKLDTLLEAVREIDVKSEEILNWVWVIYNNLNSSFAYHFNPKDGYLIDNVSWEESDDEYLIINNKIRESFYQFFCNLLPTQQTK
ncbi:hypothetical protein NIES267_73800 (plasmid) [Calothrix parasitica NIES-267]|uniref:Uncharacterized protein n=1 Tax=Calothrix parasitica NIES-267 TaxID=1973488 RepID=A0A1Z4M318_9CYAN|nr:hypothetical protein NIES267_73800 [Calothrix parasitica NIES-267]